MDELPPSSVLNPFAGSAGVRSLVGSEARPQVADEQGPTEPDTAALADTPLVVDLDGTLTPSDTLVESALKLAKSHPLDILLLPLWAAQGKANLKSRIASRVSVSADLLPYRVPLIDYLREQRATGRRIVLATASHRAIAERVATHLGLFDAVLATEHSSNLKGANKLQAIRRSVGDSFVYVGDSVSDIPVWNGARGAILVNVPNRVQRQIGSRIPIEREFVGDSPDLRDWMRALRVHQWVKNLLLFVPLLAAFSFQEAGKLSHLLLAYVSFCLAASSTYVMNDLWDLDSDRSHPRKRNRPFASGRIPISSGIGLSLIGLALSIMLALELPPGFFAVLAIYIGLTSTYSWMLKRIVLVDVLVLAVLYTLRIIAGSQATGIPVSSWLLAFSIFVFLSLALVKRCAELVSLQESGMQTSNGRDYRVADLAVLWPLGVGASLAAIVVFGLFISSPETVSSYAAHQLLWIIAIALIYWTGRMWIKTSRGEMHDDPVVFAVKDRTSRITMIGALTVLILARFVNLDVQP